MQPTKAIPPDKKLKLFKDELKNVEELVKTICIAGLKNQLQEKLVEQKYTDGTQRFFYTLYLGIDQRLTEELCMQISGLLASHTDGFTLLEAHGKFRGRQEQTILIQLAVDHVEVAYECAEKLRKEFNQSGIGIVAQQPYKRVVGTD